MPGISTYWHTLRFLRPVQLYGRIWFHLYSPRPDLRTAPSKRPLIVPFAAPCIREPSMHGPSQFSFLGKSGEVKTPADWNNPSHDKLWLYNLHYFDDLNAEGSSTRVEWHTSLIHRWIRDNTPGRGIGWQPYPTSLRIVNWVKWALARDVMPEEVGQSLAVQTRWLRQRLEYHLLGNHLLANAKAMIFAGCFFNGHEADEWFHEGVRILNQELVEQILPDGGHFELSPMYHLVVLEDLLDIVNIFNTFGQPVPRTWVDSVVKMMRWASVMTHPDGNIPFFNDAAIGVAAELPKLQDYAKRLGVHPNDWVSKVLTLLLDSGYVRLDTGGFTIFIDVAKVGPNYLPAHAHADTLSLEVSIGGQRLLVNSGTSEYGAGIERQRQRGTSAHNTVCVDGQNSSEIWAGFRVGRRATVHDITVNTAEFSISAWHDGFRHLVGAPTHFRSVMVIDHMLKVVDRISGSGSHRIQGYWHFHPDVLVIEDQLQMNKEILLRFRESTAQSIRLSFHGPVRINIEPSTYHPGFGVTVPNQRLVFDYEGLLPLEVQSTIAINAG